MGVAVGGISPLLSRRSFINKAGGVVGPNCR
jgi:hypothetical protein